MHRRRGRRQRHGRAAGHRLRRAQLQARRPRGHRAAGWCPSRRVRDRCPQDLRPPVRRHDLLGARARPGRGPRRHHRAARRRRRARSGRPADPRSRRGDHRVRDQPRPGLRPLAARHRPRGAGVGRRRERFPRPRAPGHPGGRRPGPPGRRRRRRGLPGLRGPPGDRVRPGSSHAGLHGPAHHRSRHAADLARGRRHQLRHARDRSPDPRLRRRQAAGRDRRTTCARRRAADHPRRHRACPRPGRPRGDRRLRDHRPRRRHGWRDDRDVRHDHLDPGGGGALGRRLDVPHRPAPQDHLRGGQAQRARRRPDDLRGCGRPGRRAPRRARRWAGRPRCDRRRHPARDARDRGPR